MTASTWLTGATLALVAITAYYAFKTSQLVREAIKARRPLLVPTIDFIAGDRAELRVVNAGAGAAVTLDLDFGWHPDGPQKEWTGVLPAGESENFKLLSQSDKLDELLVRCDSIRVSMPTTRTAWEAASSWIRSCPSRPSGRSRVRRSG